MKANEMSAHHVKGYLLRGVDGQLFFRIYDPLDRSRYKDYYIDHHDLEVIINDNYSSLFEYDKKKKEEEGMDGYISYPSRLTNRRKNVLPQSAQDDQGSKPADTP